MQEKLCGGKKNEITDSLFNAARMASIQPLCCPTDTTSVLKIKNAKK